MKTKLLLLVLNALMVICISAQEALTPTESAGATSAQTKTVYDFTVLDINKQPVSLSEYKGKVLLIVNTATQCGFTPQYEGLESLYEKYAEQGLVVLDFPCNQFGNQAPDTEDEIVAFCQSKYNVTFPQFAKIDVNGDNADPLYRWLKQQKAGVAGRAIRWNFEKFLIDRNGNVVKRFGTQVKPAEIEHDIVAIL